MDLSAGDAFVDTPGGSTMPEQLNISGTNYNAQRYNVGALAEIVDSKMIEFGAGCEGLSNEGLSNIGRQEWRPRTINGAPDQLFEWDLVVP